MFNSWIQAGRIQVAFPGAAQVDRHATLHSTVLGPYENPKTRLVEELDFRTSSGTHTTGVITDLGAPEPRDAVATTEPPTDTELSALGELVARG
jgi:hypothetical protein